MRLILASKSPRRSQLLHESGYQFVVQSQDTDESFPPEMAAEAVAPFLAEKKALACRNFLTHADDLLLTADSVVLLGNQVVNKPENEADALLMLRSLQNTEHRVVTGVCLLSQTKKLVFSEITHVSVAAMSDDDILFYIKNYNPLDKAGSYGIQDWLGLNFVTGIKGSYTNVMGLPTARVRQEIAAFMEHFKTIGV